MYVAPRNRMIEALNARILRNEAHDRSIFALPPLTVLAVQPSRCERQKIAVTMRSAIIPEWGFLLNGKFRLKIRLGIRSSAWLALTKSSVILLYTCDILSTLGSILLRLRLPSTLDIAHITELTLNLSSPAL